LAFCKGLGWLVFNSKNWQIEPALAKRKIELLSLILRAESAYLLEITAALLRSERDIDAKALGQWATFYQKSVEDAERAKTMRETFELAKGHVLLDVKQFEPRAWVIGFQNCIWDNGIIKPHTAQDYLTSLSPVALNPESKSKTWDEVLKAITNDDLDLAQSLQDIAGYCLSGYSNLRTLIWLYGRGGTGKSTFVSLLFAILGNLATSLDTEKLTASSDRDRLGASIYGKHLAVVHEAGNSRLSAELLKTLSGGDAYPVRFQYQEQFTANAHHVMLLISNDAPNFSNTYDEALKERIFAIPFDHRLDTNSDGTPRQLCGGQKLKSLIDDPTSDLVQGFTSWAVQGLARVLENKCIHKATAVLETSKKFIRDADPFTPFWEDCGTEFDFKKGEPIGRIRTIYEQWCNENGERPANSRKFKMLVEHLA
jgi:putative DNA primase/helicase